MAPRRESSFGLGDSDGSTSNQCVENHAFGSSYSVGCVSIFGVTLALELLVFCLWIFYRKRIPDLLWYLFGISLLFSILSHIGEIITYTLLACGIFYHEDNYDQNYGDGLGNYYKTYVAIIWLSRLSYVILFAIITIPLLSVVRQVAGTSSRAFRWMHASLLLAYLLLTLTYLGMQSAVNGNRFAWGGRQRQEIGDAYSKIGIATRFIFFFMSVSVAAELMITLVRIKNRGSALGTLLLFSMLFILFLWLNTVSTVAYDIKYDIMKYYIQYDQDRYLADVQAFAGIGTISGVFTFIFLLLLAGATTASATQDAVPHAVGKSGDSKDNEQVLVSASGQQHTMIDHT
ncbi:hypothetical protein EJ05DRAFT_509117 [Pseudovirgaria hyperparasitica]|uniref:Uncharacterized protein n=1 Tax=Pseudovirgaria hyperparasitica TaxID=470096 RepID=A0A6A6WHH5_9PEZI|nr:uncharacterized protein EJ05DRAFT_509117 [Pseudovirgaria hyperparasitica]KAF2760601.1 hypothetical protein EJ05DRAFT_509117 [Pseudovirgaria hyperparasitica]